MNNAAGVLRSIVDFFNQFLPPDRTSLWYLLIAMALGLAVGLFIFYIYKRTYSGAMYNRSFNVSLLATTVIMAMLISLIKASMPLSLGLSLGMVGAVSLVRIRTAVKESMDTVFILWAVGEGVAVGAGKEFLPVAILGAAVIGVLLYIVSIPRGKGNLPYTLIVRHEFVASNDVSQAMQRLPRNARLKSRTVTRNGVEVIMELGLPEDNQWIMNDFLRIKGVYDVKLVKMGDVYEQAPM